jgi:hypothetical protein
MGPASEQFYNGKLVAEFGPISLKQMGSLPQSTIIHIVYIQHKIGLQNLHTSTMQIS